MDQLIFDPEYTNILLEAERRFRATWGSYLVRVARISVLMVCVFAVKTIFFARDMVHIFTSCLFMIVTTPLELFLFLLYLLIVLVSPQSSEKIAQNDADVLDYHVIHQLFWNRYPIATSNKFTKLKTPSSINPHELDVRPMLPRNRDTTAPASQLSVFVKGWRQGEQPTSPPPELQATTNPANTWISEAIEGLLPDFKNRIFASSKQSKEKPPPVPSTSSKRVVSLAPAKTYGRGGAVTKSDELLIPNDEYSLDEEITNQSASTTRHRHLHYGRRIFSKAHDLAAHYPENIDPDASKPKEKPPPNPSGNRLVQKHQLLRN